jgi:hypothetical protein
LLQTKRSFITISFQLRVGIYHQEVRQNQEVLILNGTHQILAYADEVNIEGRNIDTIEKKKQKPYWLLVRRMAWK